MILVLRYGFNPWQGAMLQAMGLGQKIIVGRSLHPTPFGPQTGFWVHATNCEICGTKLFLAATTEELYDLGCRGIVQSAEEGSGGFTRAPGIKQMRRQTRNHWATLMFPGR